MLMVVCIKQVPLPGTVGIDPVTNNLSRQDRVGIINPFDRNALEAALRLKEKHGGKVVAVSMGPPLFDYSLRQALALGADEAVLLSSPAFAGADTLATAYVLARAIKKLEQPDIIFFGRHAVDADTGQVGPIVAEYLDMPQATFVVDLQVENSTHLLATRVLEKCEQVVRLKSPAVITVDSRMNKPRYALPGRIVAAANASIPVWDEHYLACDMARVGMNGSPTIVNKVFAAPKPAGQAQIISGQEAAKELIGILAKHNLLPAMEAGHE